MISVVTPFFNEEECVSEYFRRTQNVLSEMGVPYEIIAINDGSTDCTRELIHEKVKQNPNIRLINMSRNSGQWAATSVGFSAARGRYVVVMDADLQHMPEEIPRLYERIQAGDDLVSGCRQGRSEGFLVRRLPSRIANGVLRATTGCPTRDMGGFKIVRGDVAHKLQLRARPRGLCAVEAS